MNCISLALSIYQDQFRHCMWYWSFSSQTVLWGHFSILSECVAFKCLPLSFQRIRECRKTLIPPPYILQVWEGRWRVIPHDVLPDWLKDNDYLLHGHRPPMPSFRACFKSIFRIHTETGNIWTHLLGITFWCQHDAHPVWWGQWKLEIGLLVSKGKMTRGHDICSTRL